MPQIKSIFRDTLARRTDALNLQAVWEEVVEHLGKFLDTDASPAKHGIRSKSENMVVPQPAIEFVVGLIKAEYVGKLQMQLDNIDRSEVHVRQEQEEEGTNAKEVTRQGRSAQAKGHDRAVRHPRQRVTRRPQESGKPDKSGGE